MKDTSSTHERTEAELEQEIRRFDWNLGRTVHTSDGVTLTFRKHYTSFFPGVETKDVTGKDVREAMQTFLAELQAQAAG